MRKAKSWLPTSDFYSLFRSGLLSLLIGSVSLTSYADTYQLKPSPSPPDNPLKGLVPYASAEVERFPHSLEFDYVRLSELMVGPNQYDWEPMEKRLNQIASRGCQAVFRVWVEYPNEPSGLPKFLREDGVKVVEWTNREEKPATKNVTPDYKDERLVLALEQFIAAMGKRYDGDPRLGFLTAGLLGSWGEWHTWPRDTLFAPKATQERVLAAYTKAFTRTPILLRYPAGADNPTYVRNDDRPFGYHDDSFAWGTLKTGKPDDSWFYMNLLEEAGERAIQKWQQHPIGGEIRPEIWGQIFDARPRHKQAQDFMECVRQTHVTWLMESGLFEKKPSPDRIQRATSYIQRMGYDFMVRSASIEWEAMDCQIALRVVNQGVAPFYADWPMELATLSSAGEVLRVYPVDWKLKGILPSEEPTAWSVRLSRQDIPPGATKLAMRAIQPLAQGKPLRFANAEQDLDAKGWLTLGKLPR